MAPLSPRLCDLLVAWGQRGRGDRGVIDNLCKGSHCPSPFIPTGLCAGRRVARLDILENDQHVLAARAPMLDQRLGDLVDDFGFLFVGAARRPVNQYGWHYLTSAWAEPGEVPG